MKSLNSPIYNEPSPIEITDRRDIEKEIDEVRNLKNMVNGLERLYEYDDVVKELGGRMISDQVLKSKAEKGSVELSDVSEPLRRSLKTLREEMRGNMNRASDTIDNGIRGQRIEALGGMKKLQDKWLEAKEKYERITSVRFDESMKDLERRWCEDFTAMVNNPDDLSSALDFSRDAMAEELQTAKGKLQFLETPEKIAERALFEKQKRAAWAAARRTKEEKRLNEQKRLEQEELEQKEEIRKEDEAAIERGKRPLFIDYGKVKFFNPVQGKQFGFIMPERVGDEDVFFILIMGSTLVLATGLNLYGHTSRR